ncbi:MAG TPA: DUF58 domain-containing protein [Chthoniobacteraceae bacterium]|nr:DUF58 domain-containing protein [Chthoniobacteraceae bacterium]
MKGVADRLRLPFRSRTWRGQSGNWIGAGTGSSIDFQDHRPYLPGDDPRYIDWQAYARTGNYTMKLYREEVSPLVDLVFDASESMFLDFEKMQRALELLYFCVESALQSSGALRCYFAQDGKVSYTPVEQLIADPPFAGARSNATAPALEKVPWRQGSMRVLISDLLYAGAPELLLATLGMSKGRPLIFAPYCKAESEPDWLGNVELIDCESQQRRDQRVEAALLARYKETYARHFSLWRDACLRQAVVLARVPAAMDFSDAAHMEAIGSGALEIR